MILEIEMLRCISFICCLIMFLKFDISILLLNSLQTTITTYMLWWRLRTWVQCWYGMFRLSHWFGVFTVMFSVGLDVSINGVHIGVVEAREGWTRARLVVGIVVEWGFDHRPRFGLQRRLVFARHPFLRTFFLQWRWKSVLLLSNVVFVSINCFNWHFI